MPTTQTTTLPIIAAPAEPTARPGPGGDAVTAVPLALQLMKPAPPAPAFAAAAGDGCPRPFGAAITTLGSRGTAGDTEDHMLAGRLW